MGVIAGQSFSAALTGDESLRTRPMERGAAPLRGKCLGEQGQRERRRDCGAGALDRARRDQHARARCERRAGRCDREQRHSGKEGASPAEAVAEGGAGQQQRGIRECVGVDGPFERLDGAPEGAPDARQRDGDDEVVERDHEQGQRDDEERAALRGTSHLQTSRMVVSDQAVSISAENIVSHHLPVKRVDSARAAWPRSSSYTAHS